MYINIYIYIYIYTHTYIYIPEEAARGYDTAGILRSALQNTIPEGAARG